MTDAGEPWLTVVGIGEDGLAGLSDEARARVREAALVMGGSRHLDLLPDIPGQTRRPWPKPFVRAYDEILARRGTPVCVVVSGDPMWFGMGASLALRVAPEEMRILSAPSAFSLAAARLGWALQDVDCLAVHGRPLEILHRALTPGARLLILAENGETPAAITHLARERGFGPSAMTVFEHLGGPLERRLDGTVADWPHPPGADLCLVALDCRAEAAEGSAEGPAQGGLSCLAGLPDEAFRHDGQITKRDQRAVTLSRLAPRPGEVLWDIGAGSGSVAIEWMRSHPRCRAVAVESRAERCATIAANARALGVPGLRVIEGRAPEALAQLSGTHCGCRDAALSPDAPDAIFIGGGVTNPGVVDACWAALKPGGRLVANAVTLQSEAVVADLRARWGGTLTRLSVAQAEPLGGFDGWRTAMPVTVYWVRKPTQASGATGTGSGKTGTTGPTDDGQTRTTTTRHAESWHHEGEGLSVSVSVSTTATTATHTTATHKDSPR